MCTAGGRSIGREDALLEGLFSGGWMDGCMTP